MPIQIDSIGGLLAARLGRLRDGGALRGTDHRRLANFSATPVRFYFSLPPSPAARACRRFSLRLVALPVALLDLATVRDLLSDVTRLRAVDLPVIAASAQVEYLPTVIDDALDLPEIVHPLGRPQGTRPPPATRATTFMSNASTRGDAGLGALTPGPNYWRC
jgi:hypothetical protein